MSRFSVPGSMADVLCLAVAIAAVGSVVPWTGLLLASSPGPGSAACG